MTFRRLLPVLVAIAAIHNGETAILLAGQVGARVPPEGLPFARAMIFAALGWATAIPALLARAAARSPARSVPVYAAVAVQLLLTLDVLLLDVVASLVERRYSAGLASGVLLELPFTALFLRAALRDREIDRDGLGKAALLAAILFVPLFGVLAGLAYGVVRLLGFSP